MSQRLIGERYSNYSSNDSMEWHGSDSLSAFSYITRVQIPFRDCLGWGNENSFKWSHDHDGQ